MSVQECEIHFTRPCVTISSHPVSGGGGGERRVGMRGGDGGGGSGGGGGGRKLQGPKAVLPTHGFCVPGSTPSRSYRGFGSQSWYMVKAIGGAGRTAKYSLHHSVGLNGDSGTYMYILSHLGFVP